jgi:hypothetical protein
MAETLSELVVKISTDTNELKKGLSDAEKATERASQNMASSLKQVGIAMAAVGAAITATMGVAIKSAMDAVESENLFTVSLGKNADAAKAWSEELSKSLGLNAYELRKNVGTLYVMVSSMGLTEEAAYDMSTGVVQLANDMASFYNLPVTEAFDKIKSGLVGMPRPLQDLGIVINETATQTYALRTGMIAEGEEMTQQQKVLARYGALLEQTGKAQGDLARTIDSPTNKLRILGSTFEEIKVTIGTTLLPAISSLLSSVGNLLKGISEWVKENPKLADTLIKVVTALGLFLATAGTLLLVIPKIKMAWIALNTVFSASPIGLIITAIAALIAIGIVLYENWDTVSKFFVEAWSNIKVAVLTAVDYVIRALDALLGWIPGVSNAFKDARETIGNLIDSEKIMKDYRKTKDTVNSYTTALEDMVSNSKTVNDTTEKTADIVDELGMSYEDTSKQADLLTESLKKQNLEEEKHNKLVKDYLDQQNAINKQITIEQGFAGFFNLAENYSAGADLSMQRWNEFIATPEGQEAWIKANTLPSYDSGGVVPGAIGQPQLAMVHGGEEVLTPSQRGGGDTYIVNGSVLVQREIGEISLKYGRNSKRKDYTTGL